MLSHVTIGTADLARAKAFYDAVIATLGIGCIADEPAHGLVGYAEGPATVPQFYLVRPIDGRPAAVGNGQTFAFVAPGPGHRAGVSCRGTGGRRVLRGPARAPAALPCRLLRRLCPRPRRPQDRLRLPPAGGVTTGAGRWGAGCQRRPSRLRAADRIVVPAVTSEIRGKNRGGRMRIEIAVDAGDGVGEGPFWDAIEQRALVGRHLGQAAASLAAGHGRAAGLAARRFRLGGGAARTGRAVARDARRALFHGPATGERALFVAHEPDRPENRTNEAKCAPDGSFWVGTMQNNLHPDGSAKEMTGATGALYRVRHDGGITREVDGVHLANTLAWTDAARPCSSPTPGPASSRPTRSKEDGRLGVACVFNDGTSGTAPVAARSSRAIATARRSTPRAACGTPASPAPA
jgi:hypothetical protein